MKWIHSKHKAQSNKSLCLLHVKKTVDFLGLFPDNKSGVTKQKKKRNRDEKGKKPKIFNGELSF